MQEVFVCFYEIKPRAQHVLISIEENYKENKETFRKDPKQLLIKAAGKTTSVGSRFS